MLPFDQPELTQTFPETSDPRQRRLSDAEEADALLDGQLRPTRVGD
jgi:hypothetical protein